MASILDLRPPSYSIHFKKGTTLNPIFYYLNADGTTTNLTGYTAKMKAKLDKNDANAVDGFDLTTENGGLVIVTTASYTAVAGSELSDGTILKSSVVYTNPYGVKINVPPTVTTAINWDFAYFDIELVAPDTSVIPFIEGELIPSWEVTR